MKANIMLDDCYTFPINHNTQAGNVALLPHLNICLFILYFKSFSKSLKINRLLYTMSTSCITLPHYPKQQLVKNPLNMDQQPSSLHLPIQSKSYHSDHIMKNILQSQITQQNSGISYAFKGHLLIMAIEKIKMRKIYRCFDRIHKEGRCSNTSLVQALEKNSFWQKYQSPPIDGLETMQGVSTSKDNLKSVQFPSRGIPQQFKFKCSEKFLKKFRFQQKIKINELQNRITYLQAQLSESHRRQQKQMVKKRTSLQSLAQQLGEKNEVIEELKIMIKSLQNKLCLKKKNAFILEEDSQSLRRSVIHLEGVNDKLNYDLCKQKQKESASLEVISKLSSQNQYLKNQMHRLREQLFEVDRLRINMTNVKRQCQLWEKRLKDRQIRLSVVQRKINQSKRNNNCKLVYYSTEKKLQTYNQDQSQLKENRAQDKLEAIFQFLFHIQNPSHTIHAFESFSSEQVELLTIQKQKIVSLIDFNSQNTAQRNRRNVNLDQSNLYNFGLTVIDLLEKQQEIQRVNLNELKNQNEINRLRQKILSLKQKQLLVRSVLLNFIKSLELQSIHKESANILDVLFQCFEYSEAERSSIFQKKAKKFFGFI